MRTLNNFVIISPEKEENTGGFILDSPIGKAKVIVGNEIVKSGSTVYYAKNVFVGKFNENFYIDTENVIAVEDDE